MVKEDDNSIKESDISESSSAISLENYLLQNLKESKYTRLKKQ